MVSRLRGAIIVVAIANFESYTRNILYYSVRCWQSDRITALFGSFIVTSSIRNPLGIPLRSGGHHPREHSQLCL